MSKLDDYLNHNPQLQGEEFIWKKQAAAAIEVNEKTLERAAKAGKIAAKEINRKIFYSIADLHIFEAEQTAEVFKAIPTTDTPRQTATDTAITKQIPQLPAVEFSTGDHQSRLIVATVEKAEADAKKAYFEGNQTFALHEAADAFNLSIVDLKQNAKTFKGKNQRLMITKANLENYLKEL